ncbi:unnamed protein product [Protopolystoma xenopodis]|uniref:Uncharacterized protein n=1 Tax=Protopolystoma xenopodis TaxID=117903 RepID=A0A3S4ZQE4_9PLAT|nr:unnamed protein product [Protopolystoma xenopodis]
MKFYGEPTYRDVDLACLSKLIEEVDQHIKPSLLNNKDLLISANAQDHLFVGALFALSNQGRQDSYKPKITWTANNQSLDDRTDYRDSYVDHGVYVRAAAARPDASEWTRPKAPIDGLTTHAKDYTPKLGGK